MADATADPAQVHDGWGAWRLAKLSALDWKTSVPVVVLALLVGCTAVFIRLTQEYETTRVRDQQAADALWVEQTIRFQMSRDEESLQLIASDVVHSQIASTELQERMQQLERSRHEFHRIAWLEVPKAGVAWGPGVPAEDGQIDRSALARTAVRSGRPLYSQPYAIRGGQGHAAMVIDYIVPSANGAVIAIFSLDRVLTEMIPWWFAQNNEVQLLDSAGNVLASRAAAGRGKNFYTHMTLLDESGAALYLRTDSIQDKPGIFTNALAAAVLLLSFTLIWSLYALRKDMSRRARAEQQLRTEHAFRKAMDDSLETGVRARDLEGRLTYANPAFCKMVGYDASDLVGRLPPMPYWVPDAIEDHARSFSRTLAGASPRDGYESVFQRKDGTRLQVLIHEAPLIDADGKHAGWMSSILDVTDRRRIEEVNRMQQEKLLSGARLATMGELASTLSHELNQPLSAITSFATGCLNMLQAHPVKGPDQRQGQRGVLAAIESIHEQAVRAGMIVKSVHNLVKKREPSQQNCDLSLIVRGVLPLIELQATNKGVQIVSTIDARPMSVYGDPIMLEQVLLNLARNAIEELQEKPAGNRRLEIAATIVESERQRIGDSVLIRVADNGRGIPSDQVAQLFTPFFSTKAEGMGMGLSICRSAIEFHGGRIEYQASAIGGAEFRFTLRLVSVQAPRPLDEQDRITTIGKHDELIMQEGR